MTRAVHGTRNSSIRATMNDRCDPAYFHPQLAGFGGIEFVLDDERYGITEEALAERFADGEDIDDAMKLFRQHVREIVAHAPHGARRRRGGLRMIFRDDVARPRSHLQGMRGQRRPADAETAGA